MEKTDLASAHPQPAPLAMTHGVGRLLRRVATGLAFAGALVLLAMALMSVLSIVGRVVFSTPIQGDFELVQVMVATAVALFLPYCHIRRAHILVDFFTAKISFRIRRALDAAAGLLLALCAGLIALQLGKGMIDLRESGEQTMMLGFRVWIAYIPLAVSFAVLALTAAYLAWVDLAHSTRGTR
jgi:TRAP-type C4-dicarboxylate transport system permease small subunit